MEIIALPPDRRRGVRLPIAAAQTED